MMQQFRGWRVIVYTDPTTRLIRLPDGLRWEPEPHGFGGAVACRPYSRDQAIEIVEICKTAGLHGLARKIPEPATKLIELPQSVPRKYRPLYHRRKGHKREKQTLHGRNTGPARTLSARKRVAKGLPLPGSV